ncbi:hypothetical protein ACFXQA_14255 [Microbacterium sp. P07]|uniref:hypothetical protein n=1 Tax=Microbacterium sp. P07 TaxID=3366952 RepID=UPI0037472077
MSEPERPADAESAAQLPGPPPPLPDLAAVSASIERPRLASPAPRAVAHAPVAPVSAVPVAAAPVGEAPAVETGESLAQWAPAEPRAPRPVVGPWALGLAIVALAASFVVGWGLPVGLTAILVAIVALRRPVERRGVAVWALVLGVLSVLYSAGWLLWAAWQSGLIG